MVAAVKVPSGVTIWNAMRDELLMNLYQLPFTTLPPTIFHVYLHPGDFERIEGIVPRIVSELQKALTEEVRRMNEGRARAGSVLSRLIQQEEASPIETPAAGWEVYLHADRNDALKQGDLGIESMLPLPPPVEFGGPPTTRIVRSLVTGAGRSSTTIEVQQPAQASRPALSSAEGPALSSVEGPALSSVEGPALSTAEGLSLSPVEGPALSTAEGAGAEFTTAERACLRYEDDQGPHVFSMRKDVLSVGRGGSSVWVDVQVVTSPKVSREHFRLRRDRTGDFFIQDFSAWGTSVDGRPLAAAVTGADGVLRPGAEQLLQAPARIELADALVILFEAKRDK